jgi:hypothetical protein
MSYVLCRMSFRFICLYRIMYMYAVWLYVCLSGLYALWECYGEHVVVVGGEVHLKDIKDMNGVGKRD